MFEIIMYGLVLILSLIGLAHLIRSVAMWLFFLKGKTTQVLTVLLDTPDAEMELRCALENVRYFSPPLFKVILAVDCGLPENTREVCRKLASDYGNVIYCKSENLSDVIENNCWKTRSG